MDLSPKDIAMLKGLNFAHLVTLNPDGGPHSTPLWIDVDDRGHVMMNSAVGRRKDRNIRRDPRVALSLQPQDDPYTWISIQGTVVSIETGDEAEQHIDTLNRRYHDDEAWTYVEGQQRVIYRVRADKILRSD